MLHSKYKSRGIKKESHKPSPPSSQESEGSELCYCKFYAFIMPVPLILHSMVLFLVIVLLSTKKNSLVGL